MERYSVGEKVDAKITQIDQSGRKFSLSIKALEIEEEKRAMAEYGSSSSGASLGEILGPAISEKEEAEQTSNVDVSSSDGATGSDGNDESDVDQG